MLREDLKLLTNIYQQNAANSEYRYKSYIPDSETLSGKYHPVFCERYYVYDYTETAKQYLQYLDVVDNTPGCQFVRKSSDYTRMYYLSHLTVEQAQQIIDRNIVLFNQIQQKVAQNKLLADIDRI